MGTLYDIQADIQKIIEFWEESGQEEFSPEKLETLNGLQISKEQKLANYCALIKNWTSEGYACNEEIQRLKKKAQTLDNKTESLKKALLYLFGKDFKWQNGVHKISVRESLETIIDDLDLLPEAYAIMKVTKQPDKKLIKSVLEQPGGKIPGARLQTNQNVQIK